MSLSRVVRRLLPAAPSTNLWLRKSQVNPYDLIPKRSVIFDLGSTQKRGAYPFGSPPPEAKIVCVDIDAAPGVDLVADAHDMHMVDDESVDCIVSVAMLEYVHDPKQVVSEIYRILKPGGVAYLSGPFVFPLSPHATMRDFYRFSYDGLEVLCKDFERVDSGFNRGPASATSQILVHFLAIVFSFNSRRLYGINVDLFRWLLFWIKYLDLIIGRYDVARAIYSGAYFLGRKSG